MYLYEESSTKTVTQQKQYYKGKGNVHPCTGTEALYRPYGP
jgi:hypothetical protein